MCRPLLTLPFCSNREEEGKEEGRERAKGIKRFIVVVIALIELALDEEHVVSTCRVNDER